MIIYGALLIPLITALILYRFFQHKTVWWELTVPVAASAILIFSLKACVEHTQLQSEEYWGSFVERVEYYEDWDEWVERTCTSTCCCDSKGNNCRTTYYDCSYRLYHPAEYKLYTTSGESMTIGKAQYERIRAVIGNERFVELNRDYYREDGDEYECTWGGDSATAVPVTTLHQYENRIKAADQSVFHFQPVDKEDVERFRLASYPEIRNYYEQDAVLGDNSPDAQLANKKLQYLNGLLGSRKEVRLYILVYKNQPLDAAFYQEWYWSGGNMNEFVLCVGIDSASRRVQWAKVLSWTPNEELKVAVKNYVQAQEQLSLVNTVEFLQGQIDGKFIRRDFREFDYLTVEPPLWSVVLAYVLTLLINVGLSYWIIHNDIREYYT